MSNIAAALETIRDNTVSAQAFIESLELEHPVLVLSKGAADFEVRRSGEVLESAVLSQNDGYSQQVLTDSGKAYDSKGDMDTSLLFAYVALGELCLQLDNDEVLPGVGFAFSPDAAGPVEVPGALQILRVHGQRRFGSDLVGAVIRNTFSPREADDLDAAQKRHLVLDSTFTPVPTFDAAQGVTDFVMDRMPSSRDDLDFETFLTGVATTDSGLDRIRAARIPELSERAVLTRYLLHQLEPNATLYGNRKVEQEIQRLLDAGVEPIGFDDLRSEASRTVAATVAHYTALFEERRRQMGEA